MDSDKKSLFDSLSGKAGFLFGFISGAGLICVIALIALLSVFLGGDDLSLFGRPGDKTDNNGYVNPTGNTGVRVGDDGADEDSGVSAVNFEITKDDHVRGDFNAPITLVEFSDFQCPYCKDFHPTTKRLLDEYPGKVRLVYKHFPLSSIHPFAQSAAEASECASEVGGNDAFWEFSDRMFENQESLGKDLYVKTAAEIGLNSQKFTECVDSGKFREKVLADLQLGTDAGVRGTPGSYINNQSVPGAVPFEKLKGIVEGLL